jgi:hypothetical protein
MGDRASAGRGHGRFARGRERATPTGLHGEALSAATIAIATRLSIEKTFDRLLCAYPTDECTRMLGDDSGLYRKVIRIHATGGWPTGRGGRRFQRGESAPRGARGLKHWPTGCFLPPKTKSTAKPAFSAC